MPPKPSTSSAVPSDFAADLEFIKADPERLAAVLREIYPRGMHMNAAGVITAAGTARRITDLAALGEIARAPKTFQVEFRGEMIEFEVRGLNSIENAEADKLDAGILPPQKFKQERGQKVPDGYDVFDPEYRRKRDAAERLKAAFILSKGIVGMEIPGDTLEAKADFLSQNFTPQIVSALLQAVLDLTSTTLDKASFI